MTPERWEAVKRIFAWVVELPPEARRAALVRECVSDPTLRREVEELLEAHARAPDGFLADAAPIPGGDADPFAGLPERFGPCRIEHRLGSGGMGTVFLATMVEERPWATAGARVAVKVLHPDLLIDPAARQRLAREHILGGQVEHPAVVRVHALEVVRTGAASYHGLIQEYVPGQTLRQLMQELGPVPEPLLRQVALEVARGLEAIHTTGAIHRDLKPENLVFTPEQRIKILDLGAVHLIDGDGPRLTESRAFVGSSRYAAPEQFEGTALGPAADLYALGVVLYEAATGTNPFVAPGIHAVMRLHLEKVPPRAGTLRPDLTPFFEELLVRLLAKRPEGRFACAGDLARVLEEGEASSWWRDRERELIAERTLRRTRVAREDEVAMLLGAWAEARKGHGALVLVEGEAGIGKSRLIEEVLERAAADAEPVLLAGSLLFDLGRRDEALPYFMEAERLAQWSVGALPQAYLALAGERDVRSVVISENAPVTARAEVHLVLHRAGAGGDHLARARALCEHLSRHLSGDGLAQFWRNNPTARGVLGAERRA